MGSWHFELVSGFELGISRGHPAPGELGSFGATRQRPRLNPPLCPRCRQAFRDVSVFLPLMRMCTPLPIMRSLRLANYEQSHSFSMYHIMPGCAVKKKIRPPADWRGRRCAEEQPNGYSPRLVRKGRRLRCPPALVCVGAPSRRGARPVVGRPQGATPTV